MHEVSIKQTFPYYIEDWLLWLAAKRTATGDEIDFPWYAETPVSLANYDVSFIMRSSTAIENNIGLTENQKKLAIKIVTKYQKQIWSKLNKDVSYLGNLKNVTRLEVRTVDKTCNVYSDDGYWYVVFPYDPPMVDQMHKLSAHGAGVFAWQGDDKRWQISRNECNLCLIVTFLKQWKDHPWEVDSQTQELIQQAQVIIENKYKFIPHVDIDDYGKKVLANSNQFIDKAWERVSGMDLYNAVFRADSMGLTISEKIENQIFGFLPHLASAIIVSQSQINASSKTLYSHLPVNLINDFAQYIKADHWVFVSYNNGSNTSGLLEAAVDAEIDGEKIFFTDNVPRLSYNYFTQIKENLSGDIIMFVDNFTVLEQVNTQLAPEFPILKTFYSHGGNR